MADNSHIEWTDAKWNPLRGCSRVPDGSSEARWTGKVAMASDEVLTAPLRWRKPRMIFVNSMSDLFHEDVPDAWIDRVFAVMALTPHHTFQVLTKRSARMREYLNGTETRFRVRSEYKALPASGRTLARQLTHLPVWPLPNVWLGVSVEDQTRADERIPHLLATPAAIRWISAEPLLEPVDLTKLSFEKSCDCIDHAPALDALEATVYCEGCCEGAESLDLGRLDWVVVGGESGPGARPMHPDWARSLRDQCAAAGVPFHFKQWGNWLPGHYSQSRHSALLDQSDGPDCGITLGAPPHANVHDWKDGHIGIAVGKARAGRVLDGVTHDAMPSPPGWNERRNAP